MAKKTRKSAKTTSRPRASAKASRASAKRTTKKSAKTAKRSSSATSAKSAKRGSQKRTLLTRSGKNVAFAKRRGDGTFKENDSVSRSLSSDRRRTAKTAAKPGYGDQGDAKRKR